MISRAGSDKAGFSLLELLVVLSLLGLSAALVLPAIEKGLKAREVRQSALALAAVARDLRGRAVATGSLQQLRLYPSESGYQAAGRERVHLPSAVSISAVHGGEPSSDGSRRFLFFPNGSAYAGEISIASDSQASYSIHIDPLLGRVSVARAGDR